VAHGDGRFYAPAEDLKRIYDQELVWLKYLKNPNGSMGDIAGVMNEKRNVVGLMPHPERAIAEWMGGMAGWGFL
jgi:phosphoribosylformylglycinamidine synthase